MIDNVPGILRRWRADTIAQSNATAVASWSAMTGGGALAQATGTKQPQYITSGINGKPVVRFDGVDDLLTQTITNVAHPITWVLIAKLTATATSYRQVVQSGSEIWLNSTDGWTLYANTTIVSGIETTNPVCIIGSIASSTDAQLYLDGTQRATGAVGSLSTGTSLAVGNHATLARPFNGDIAELLLIDHAVTANEKSWIDTYAQNYYAIPVSDYLSSGFLSFF